MQWGRSGVAATELAPFLWSLGQMLRAEEAPCTQQTGPKVPGQHRPQATWCSDFMCITQAAALGWWMHNERDPNPDLRGSPAKEGEVRELQQMTDGGEKGTDWNALQVASPQPHHAGLGLTPGCTAEPW